MKTIGLIGGVSWTSSLEYYRRINKEVYKRLGGFNSAKVLLYSINFEEILTYQATNDSEREEKILADAALRLEHAGADCILICSNTTNKTSQEIQKRIKTPLINIIEATAQFVVKKRIHTVGLLGTKYVMYGDFYKKFFNTYNISIQVLEKEKGMKIHDIIYKELVKDIYLPDSKDVLLNSIHELGELGAEAVILGCTELPLLANQSDTNVTLIDSIQVHVDKALEFAL